MFFFKDLCKIILFFFYRCSNVWILRIFLHYLFLFFGNWLLFLLIWLYLRLLFIEHINGFFFPLIAPIKYLLPISNLCNIFIIKQIPSIWYEIIIIILKVTNIMFLCKAYYTFQVIQFRFCFFLNDVIVNIIWVECIRYQI